jgi:putative membrane protein
MAEVDTATRLAVGRTGMAANRTLMAWIRTSISMISFGYTIYKVIQGLQDSATGLSIVMHPALAGLVLTGLGILSLVVGMVEHYMVFQQLRQLAPISYWRHTLWIALLVLCVAAAIFIGILTRLI